MSRTALALVFVAASASSAFAGPFVGLGIGTNAVSGDFNIDPDGRSGRLMLGYRFGRISVEGMGTRYDLYTPDQQDWTGTTLAIAGRYNLPLSDGFEVFGRLGLQRTSLTGNATYGDFTGNGILLGGGAEFRLPIAAAAVSLFVDYSVVHSSLANDAYSDVGLTSRFWTLGATLSF